MVLFGDKHLHIEKNDRLVDTVATVIKAATNGTIRIAIKNQPLVKINLSKGRIMVDLLEPTLFKSSQDETGLFDKIKTSKEFADKLSDNDLTISLLRKGKEVLTLGKEAKPKLSRLLTRSNHIQIDNIKETVNLESDFKVD